MARGFGSSPLFWKPMKTRLLENAQDAVLMHARTRLKKIVAKPTQGLFNFRCFENAVQYAKENDNAIVVEVMLDDNGVPILHFINKDLNTGEYLETTQGWRADHMDYYLIKEIHPEQYAYIGRLFNAGVDSWSDQFAGKWYHKLLGIRRIV